jgi:hypothetical protein
VAALFEANGYAWAHHEGGKLAQDIAYAQATDTTPLSGWASVTGFSGLHSLHKRHLPALVIGDYLAFLLAQFPDAYFIHTHRDPADWISTRFWADEGEHRQSASWHAGVTEGDLPALWSEEFANHRDYCAELFKGSSRFLDIKISPQSADTMRNFLIEDFELSQPQITQDAKVTAEDIQSVLTYIGDLPDQSPQPPTDITFAMQVADYCAQSEGHNGSPKNLSPTSVTWTKDYIVTDRMGETVAMAPSKNGYLLHPDADAFVRAQGALNTLQKYGAQPPLQIDMMDARFLGSAGRRHAPRKTVSYNRRSGATNLTLWPLPAYHTLAPRGHVGGFANDQIPFEDKADRCVWLGNMTGRMSPVLTREDRPLRGVYNIRNQMQKLTADSPDWADVIADLMSVPRYHVVKTLIDNPDFEVGLVLRGQWKRLSSTPAFKGLCVPKQPRTWFHKFRYILSLAGNDTGSNFMSAASSNALILKEEDGWELFYTDAFKPWVHYVPLAEGATDVAEKLVWARANPEKSKAMSDAATQLYDKFANPNNRDAILSRIAARLNDMSD